MLLLGSCHENILRLVHGSMPVEGRVEVCRNGRFGTICGHSFDIEDGFVICRQLGFEGGMFFFGNRMVLYKFSIRGQLGQDVAVSEKKKKVLRIQSYNCIIITCRPKFIE